MSERPKSDRPKSDRPRNVQVLSKERLHDGYTKVDRYVFRHDLYAGGLSKPITREVIERGHAAALLLFDPETDAVVMIEQFRPGAYGAGLDPWLLEVVAGIIEDGETAEEVCRREALEEAGCRVGAMIPVHRFVVTPGVCTETIELFAGRVDSTRAGGIHGLDEEGEDIRVVVLSVDELAERVAAGKVVNATTLIAAQWLLLNHATVKERLGAAT